jgi:hypothetical protein
MTFRFLGIFVATTSMALALSAGTVQAQGTEVPGCEADDGGSFEPGPEEDPCLPDGICLKPVPDDPDPGFVTGCYDNELLYCGSNEDCPSSMDCIATEILTCLFSDCDGYSVEVGLCVVPEPARWQMLVAGTAFLGLLYQRRRARGLRFGYPLPGSSL